MKGKGIFLRNFELGHRVLLVSLQILTSFLGDGLLCAFEFLDRAQRNQEPAFCPTKRQKPSQEFFGKFQTKRARELGVIFDFEHVRERFTDRGWEGQQSVRNRVGRVHARARCS